jgi:hypothetical protein
MDDLRRADAQAGAALDDLAVDGPAEPTLHDPDDAMAAHAARDLYDAGGLRCVEPDATVGPLLGAGERVVAATHGVVLRTGDGHGRGEGQHRDPGDLYVTTRRILVADQGGWSLALDAVRDAAIGRGRLVLLLDGGCTVTVATPRPRLLRALIAVARADRAAAVRSASDTSGRPRGDSGR